MPKSNRGSNNRGASNNGNNGNNEGNELKQKSLHSFMKKPRGRPKKRGTLASDVVLPTRKNNGGRPKTASEDSKRMRKSAKPDGTPYWEFVLCYVDDLLVISHDPKKVMDHFARRDDPLAKALQDGTLVLSREYWLR